MVVDDLVIYRKVLSDVVGQIEDFEVVATASNGVLALRKMEMTPVDVVLLDVYMPGMDGLETLAKIQEKFPDTIVVMVSGIASREAEIVVKALNMGALEFIPKPAEKDFQSSMAMFQRSMSLVAKTIKLRFIASGKFRRGLSTTAPKEQIPIPAPKPFPPPIRRTDVNFPSNTAVLAIGVSTGGPQSLTKIIPMLPEDFPIPIVMVQHMPPLFTASLAQSLDKVSKLKVTEAVDGEPAVKGKVLIAPGGKHMILRKSGSGAVVSITDGAPENGCKPAVDVLYRSLGDCYGDKGILTVILTGMGSDGLAGVRELKNKHCFCITQSARSCIIYGMPRAVDEAGLSDLQLDLDDIPSTIVNLLSHGRIK